MSAVLDWLANYWSILCGLGLCLANLLVLIFKKKVKVSSITGGLLSVIPDYINEAEALGVPGADKFSIVMAKSIKYLMAATNETESVIITKYASLINDSIESILSTPKKK